MVLKSVLETCLYPPAKLGNGGLCDPWGLEMDSEETCCPGGEGRTQLPGLGVALLLVVCQLGSGPRDMQPAHASRHHLLLSTKRLERCLGSEDTGLFNANPLSTSKGESCIPSLEARGTAKKCEINDTQHYSKYIPPQRWLHQKMSMY